MFGISRKGSDLSIVPDSCQTGLFSCPSEFIFFKNQAGAGDLQISIGKLVSEFVVYRIVLPLFTTETSTELCALATFIGFGNELIYFMPCGTVSAIFQESRR